MTCCRQFEDVFQLLQRVNLEELYPKFEQEEVDMDARMVMDSQMLRDIPDADEFVRSELPGLSGLVKDLTVLLRAENGRLTSQHKRYLAVAAR